VTVDHAKLAALLASETPLPLSSTDAEALDLSLPAADDRPVAATLWEVPGGKTAGAGITVISGATGVSRSFYSAFAAYLARTGNRVLTFDFRGVGGSRPAKLRGFRAAMTDWGASDLAGVIRWCRETHPRSPLTLVGHSAGGQMVGLCPEAHQIRAMVAIGAQSGYWGHWDPPHRYLLPFVWYLLVPAISHTFGYFPGRRLGLFADLPKGVALEWARWCRSPRYLVSRSGEPLGEYFQAVDADLLALSFSDDIFAPERAVDDLTARFTRSEVTRHHIRPEELGKKRLGHFEPFRRGHAPELWELVARWLVQHTPGTSTAEQEAGDERAAPSV
jgi:predicted alpha/beta hydrolase